MPSTPEEAVKILALLAEHDLDGMVNWRCDGEYAPISIFVRVHDTFGWGCADAEDLTIDNLSELERAIKDCVAIDPVCGALTACDLFAARLRHCRPQGAAYPKDKALWPLFDACGPERPIDFGNPYAPGDYRPETWGAKKSKWRRFTGIFMSN